jgi:protein tyrosine kinase modulator
MSLSQLFTILFARSGWILLCLAVAIGAAAAVSYLLPPTYTATTSVVIGFREADPLERQSGAEPLSPGYLATQVEIAGSRPVARKVVERLELRKDPAMLAQFRHGDGRGSFEDWAAGQLLKRLDVRPERESRVVDLHFSAHDPQQAAAGADAFAQAYIDTRLKLDVDPARRNSTWLKDQLQGLREDLERTQTKLTAYQRRYGLVGNGDQLDIETQRLNELATQLVTAQAQRQEAIARQLGVNHPDYQRAVAQEEALRREVAEQKARVLHLRKRYDQADMLRHEVESAQHAYDAALQRHSQTSLEGRVEQANVSILSPAVVPVTPSSPNVPLNLALGIVVGFAIGVGAALLREIADRRIRSPRDVESELGIPLLGELLRAP